jgi:branched-subunit amino acid aminotransferase/4-amino-4-deoxychorismate lyase
MATVAEPRRPDPRQGVFETLLVLDGRPVELDPHLTRLRASLVALYPDLTPPRLDVQAQCTDSCIGVLRIAVAPERGGRLSVTVKPRPATGHFATENGGKVTTEAVSLCSTRLPGGLGAHKWVDRSLLDDTQAKLPSDTLPLLVDSDGSVLEASRANVFAVRDGTLLSPPTDGRILPGVTRMRVLEVAGGLGIDTSEMALSRKDLLGADEVFLTGSVRGIEPAASFDGEALSGSGPITAALAAELCHAWLGTPVT